MQETKQLYRYEISYSSSDGDETDVQLRTYNIIKETEKCYFINPIGYSSKLKRCNKTAMRTFAFDTKEKAKNNFIMRTQDRIRWFEYWKEECENGLKIINDPKSFINLTDK